FTPDEARDAAKKAHSKPPPAVLPPGARRDGRVPEHGCEVCGREVRIAGETLCGKCRARADRKKEREARMRVFGDGRKGPKTKAQLRRKARDVAVCQCGVVIKRTRDGVVH